MQAMMDSNGRAVFVLIGDEFFEVKPAVTPVTEIDICDECGSAICDCVTTEQMAALLERIDADPHGKTFTGWDLPY